MDKKDSAEMRGGLGLPPACSVKQWAETFGVSPHTVYRAVASGELAAIKVRGALRILRDKSFELMGIEP